MNFKPLISLLGSIIYEINMNGGLWIALLALLVTILHGFETRRHNKLSVKPALRIDSKTVIGESNVVLFNAGIGPAIIKSFKILVIDQELDGFTDNWAEEASKILVEKKGVPSGLNFLSNSFSLDEVLSPNEKLLILDYHADRNKKIEHANLLGTTLVQHIKFKIIYESIYGEKFITKSDSYPVKI